jgi:Tol biopolymer transport system component
MKIKLHPVVPVLALFAILSACAQQPVEIEDRTTDEAGGLTRVSLPRILDPDPNETHFGELRMLTDGGENAEAYFSFAGDQLIFQSTRPPHGCDQIFTLDIETAETRIVSTGLGRTTCAYFLPGDHWIVYASTHLASPDCPPPPDMSRGYVWPIHPDYDIFRARSDGSGIERLTDTPGYDAEATVSPLGNRLVFTSMRDGDLDIYTMNIDGTEVARLTDGIGYDGGAFFSPDGSKIVYRARHPEDPQEIADYQALLGDGLIRPSQLEIWVMDADGSNKTRVTDLGVAAFAPFFHPSGGKIIFSSNFGDPSGREFDLWMVDLSGQNLERITFTEGFDGFPMWSADGTKFVFCSNRHNSKPGETNVFVTEWQD